MYKKIIIYLLFIFFVIPYYSYNVLAEIPTLNCSKYSSEFNQCAKANESWDGSARWITEFTCLDENWAWAKILSQIILDKKFSEIDKEIEKYIEWLEKNKKYSSEKLDEVVNKFYIYWEYWNKYEDLCKKWILKEMFTCLDKFNWNEVKDFLWWENNWACIQLVHIKLKAYREVLYSILKLNKLATRKSARSTYIKSERSKYDNLIKMMSTIRWYLNRILKWWTSKTKSPYNCK